MTENSPKWLSAADCAARTGLTVRALRVYEREGLLKPSRAANGWRRYGPDDLRRLNTISVLKALGLSLGQIRKLLRESEPSLLKVLQVQAESWRERRGEANKALELVEAAIRRLERNQQPALEELCALVNALQARSIPMQNRATLMMDLMTELLSAEERTQWQNWWAANAHDMNQNTRFTRERAECFAVMLEQQQQGLPPDDPAVQEQVAKQAALIRRYGVRERTVRLMNWNLELTTKFMEMGAIARERHPHSKVLPFPALGQQAVTFLEQAMFASAPARAAMVVLKKVQALIESQADPRAPEAAAVVQEFAQLCAQYDLGDPGVYVRFMPFMAHVNHQTLPANLQQAYDFLAQALPVRESAAPTGSPSAAVAPTAHFTPAELEAVRRAYARQMGLMAGVIEPRVEAAYSGVAREKFLGPGPWSVMSILRGTFMMTPDASPVHVYVDSAVSIVTDKKLNNGQPSLYYRLLAETLVPEGSHLLHIGAGTGYYSAILAQLTGRGGRVTAIELEPQLAERARENLEDWPQVEVLQGDATQMPVAPADLILVSAGVTRLVDHWLDALKDGGQLIVPLMPDAGMGIFMGIRRRGERYFAAVLSPVMIYHCAGARDPESAAALAEALKQGGGRGVTRLYRGESTPAENVWLQGRNWCLAYG
ncbi:MAG TPA: MerR family transcriptional regulator [Steroidobacteraceae bacterium]|nr:MerR family transcriptional regulator [Steroidobacteraceae bacterium]